MNLVETYSEAVQRYSGNPEVTGIMLGRKTINGKLTSELAVCIHVRRKKPQDKVKAKDLIPKHIGSLRTDVIQMKPCKPCQMVPLEPYSNKSKVSVIHPGISIGPDSASYPVGTLGLICYDNTDNRAVALTCFHSVSHYQRTPASYVLQPSHADQGIYLTDRVGATSRYIIDGYGDACIFVPSVNYALSMYSTHDIITSAAFAVVADSVKKVGRSTGVTEGTVSAVGRLYINYFNWGQGIIYMNGFSFISNNNDTIAAEGDSGALVYNPSTLEGYGLLTTTYNNSGTLTAFACNLPTVFTRLNLSLLTAIEADSEELQGSMNVATQTETGLVGTMNVVEAYDTAVFRTTVVPAAVIAKLAEFGVTFT